MNFKKIKSTRFCDLPDGVPEHILSFLAIKDIIRVGCVSKRYSKLQPSSLSLSLDKFPDASLSTCDQRKQLLGSLDKFMIRRGCHKIERFRFTCSDHHHDQHEPQCCTKDLSLLIIRWIYKLLRCNVEELHLDIDLPPKVSLAFPSCVFHCKSLKYLSLKGIFTNIESLSSTSFSNLETLELREVNVIDEGFFEWISHSCKSIKKLQLENIRGFSNAILESSSLKSFTIVLNKDFTLSSLNINCEKLEDIFIHWGLPCSRTNYAVLTLSAPNIRKLKWSGNMMNFQDLGEFERLEKAEIDLDHEVIDFYNISKLFSSLRRVKDLTLTETTMKCLFEEGFLPTQEIFPGVCCLRIRRLSLTDDEVPAMVSLLEGLPKLVTLEIEGGSNGYDHNSHSIDMRYWKSQKLNFVHLKEVNIELSKGSNGVIFTQYILDHVPNLQKMVIHHLPEKSYKVKSFKWKATSDTKVIFHVRKKQGRGCNGKIDY